MTKRDISKPLVYYRLNTKEKRFDIYLDEACTKRATMADKHWDKNGDFQFKIVKSRT